MTFPAAINLRSAVLKVLSACISGGRSFSDLDQQVDFALSGGVQQQFRRLFGDKRLIPVQKKEYTIQYS